MNILINNFGYILAGYLFYAGVKSLYVKYETEKTKYRLYAIRDKVRKEAIDQKGHNRMMFQFLDYTISKNVGKLEELSIWLILYYAFKHVDDVEMQRKFEIFQKDIDKDQHFSVYFEELSDVMSKYIKNKSMISYNSVRFILKTVSYTLTILSQVSQHVKSGNDRLSQVKHYVERSTRLPELSAVEVC